MTWLHSVAAIEETVTCSLVEPFGAPLHPTLALLNLHIAESVSDRVRRVAVVIGQLFSSRYIPPGEEHYSWETRVPVVTVSGEHDEVGAATMVDEAAYIPHILPVQTEELFLLLVCP